MVPAIICPACQKPHPPEHFACAFARKGGKTTGKAKARTTEQATKAANARWAKARRAKQQEQQQLPKEEQ